MVRSGLELPRGRRTKMADDNSIKNCHPRQTDHTGGTGGKPMQGQRGSLDPQWTKNGKKNFGGRINSRQLVPGRDSESRTRSPVMWCYVFVCVCVGSNLGWSHQAVRVDYRVSSYASGLVYPSQNTTSWLARCRGEEQLTKEFSFSTLLSLSSYTQMAGDDGR